MPNSAKYVLFWGIFVLSLSIVNWSFSETITPELLRAEVLSGISGVIFMLIASIWTEIIPKKVQRKILKGKQGFDIEEKLSDELKEELAWGSQLLLTATSASSVLIYWKNKTILKRGLISKEEFIPGNISLRAKKERKLISLGKTILYPDHREFDKVYKDLPSVIIYSLGEDGLIVVGGFSERCFTKSDEIWIIGWSDRICQKLVSSNIELN